MRPLLAALLACALYSCHAAPAFAHMHDRPDLDQWLRSLNSAQRGPCCDSTEAETMADPDWKVASEMKPGECKKGNPGITDDKPPVFCVRLEYPDPEDAGKFEWWEVPPGAIVMKNETEEEPNRAGPALLWLYWVRTGDGYENMKPYIRCFVKGALS